MTIKEFADILADAVSALLDFEAEIKVVPVIKNNDVMKTAIMIREPSTNIAPNIYIDEMYERYLEHGNLMTVARGLVRIYMEWRIQYPVDISNIIDYTKAKSRICFKLINKERNAERLINAPTIEYLDLLITFNLITSDEIYGEGSILVTHEIMEKWGVTVEELLEVALVNSQRILKDRCMDMTSFIKDHLSMDEIEEFNRCYANVDIKILTNDRGCYGATALLYTNKLMELAEYYADDLIIIPSSVHELIIMPLNFVRDQLYDMDDFIEFVNNNYVDQESILSSHAYYYSRKECKVVMSLD